MRLICSLIFFYALLCCNSGMAQSFNFKNYNTEQGLPQSQVLCIFQDHGGNLWFGTNSGGAGKFDGNKFTTVSDEDGLANNVVFAITETPKKELLFGTSKGLSVFNGLRYTNYDENNGLSNSWIYCLLQDGTKTWIGTQEGVFTYENNRITPFAGDSILDKASVYAIYPDRDKNLWFATLHHGVVMFDAQRKSFRHFSEREGLMNKLVFSLLQRDNGDMLIGTLTGLNSIGKNGQVRRVAEIGSNGNMAYSCMLPGQNGTIIFGTHSEGVLGFDFNTNKRNLQYNQANGLTNNPILCLFRDRENNLWIGTDGSGVYQYKNDKFIYYTKSNGLPENYVNTVAQDKLGRYWVALRSNGLCLIDGNTTSILKRDDRKANTLPDNDVNTILPLNDGRIFFGTKDGLSIYENGQFHTVKDFGFRNKYILSLYEDSKKTVWIGTPNGLYRYRNGVIEDEKLVNQFGQKDMEFLILCTLEDKNGNLWVGTENGAIRSDGKSAGIFNDKTGFFNKRVLSMLNDYKGNIWFGTEEGLYHYDFHKFTRISPKEGLSSGFINFLQMDNHKRLVIGTNTGIDLLSLGDFYEGHIAFEHFNKGDGLLNLESNYNASFKDNKGRILVGTIDGLEIYDPDFDTRNTKEALTRINDVKLFFGQENIAAYAHQTDSTDHLPQNLELPFSKNHLTFHYIGVSLSAPEKVMYRFKLEGADQDWSPPTPKTEATYSSLQPGHYTFMVKAMNNDGVWNKEAVLYSFDILPPWYRTWWFYTLCGLVLLGGIMSYNSYKTRKLTADKQKLENEVGLRTRELREEKEKVETINKEVVAQKAIIEHKNEEITDSIKYAKNIQEALLPSLKDIYTAYPDSFILYMPKDIVSGDFYWFARKNNMKYLAAVDCTGHGVPGAFMSIVGNTLLNEIVNEKNITEPGDILLELHKGVKEALNQNNQSFERRDGMDIALIALEENSGTMHFSGANRPLWIFRKNNPEVAEIIKPNKFPIGGLEMEEQRVYENHTLSVEPGDCVYIFSDGYADQFGGPKGKKFMLANLQRLLAAITTLPIADQKQQLDKAFADWKQDGEQVDDVLVIGLRV